SPSPHLPIPSSPHPPISLKAIAWRWGHYFPLPSPIDIAYRLRLNEWNGKTSVELELMGVRSALPSPPELADLGGEKDSRVRGSSLLQEESEEPESSSLPFEEGLDGSRIEFYYNKCKYTCNICEVGDIKELRIRNLEGQVLSIQPQQRRGLFGKRREDAAEIDVVQPHYFNLIRAAVNALELAEKHQLLQEKERLIVEKDQHITMLSQQLESLNRELNQLSQEQQQCRSLQTKIQPRQAIIQTHETPIAQLQLQVKQGSNPPTADDLKRAAKAKLGAVIWKCLNSHSQRDLIAAYTHQQDIRSESFTAHLTDYSEAGLRLGFAVEREIIQPFFKQIHQFLLANGGSSEIGGVTLKARKKYTLEMLPPLLADQWHSFQETLLMNNHPCPEEHLYYTVTFNSVNAADRTTVKTFLQQWNHPIAQWLLTQDTNAASAIDQINRLRNIATHTDHLLHEWHFELLQALVIGNETRPGIFREIYG
ncbi:MAG: hypothetical protein HC769_23030, partial [Cyanobacteria bacterium CRU_2_1]|nr:hypothetical protein [Cyanobacteria bacterium CRU_2_1]